MSDGYTEADEVAALRFLMARLLGGVHGEPITTIRGKKTSSYYRGEHDASLVERARSHFDGRKQKRLLVRLESVEAALIAYMEPAGDTPEELRAQAQKALGIEPIGATNEAP